MKDASSSGFEIHLQRRERSYSFGESRPRSFSQEMLVAQLDPADLIGRLNDLRINTDSVSDIKTLIKTFEKLPVDQVVGSLGTITTDPYISVSDGKKEIVDREKLVSFIESGIHEITNALSERIAEPEEVDNLNILQIDEKTAVATYQTRKGALTGSSAVVVVNDGTSWKIAVHVPHPYTPA